MASVAILSPTERRVAELVALGRRNEEVAAELGLGVKTVEGHLTRVYRKLGLRSRTELAALAGARGVQELGARAARRSTPTTRPG